MTPERDPIRPDISCTPTVAGIVAAVAEGDEAIYTLEDGTEVRMGRGGSVPPVRLFGLMPTVGDLLLYGESEACGPFRARAVPRDRPSFPGCLAINDFGLDDGDFVLLESGLRLLKADGFETRPIRQQVRPVLSERARRGRVLRIERPVSKLSPSISDRMRTIQLARGAIGGVIAITGAVIAMRLASWHKLTGRPAGRPGGLSP